MKAQNKGKWSQKEGKQASKAALNQVDVRKEGRRTQIGDEKVTFTTKKV